MPRLEEEKRKQFITLFDGLEVDKLDISDYNKLYLKKHLQSLEYSVILAWQILELGVEKLEKPIEKISMAEIGGGTGIISLLAKWLGFGTVVYTDIYEQSCTDFEVISNTLGLKPTGILVGSINELAINYRNQIDLLVSRDVVEHIYNPALFFKHSIQNFKNAILVHNTSANIYNVFRKKYFKKIHQMDEWEWNGNQFKPGDSLESFYKMRLDFIRREFPSLSVSRSEILAAITRGQVFSDIKTEVKNYLITQKLPSVPKHPTNTCDPANGNWTEHLLTFEEYELFVNNTNYKIHWQFAPYDEWRNTGLKKIILKFFNLFIKNTGRLAKFISPAVIMVSVPERKLTI
ncbi:MAG: methyltransferase domain-containing protein [Bacteroidia bacterium]